MSTTFERTVPSVLMNGALKWPDKHFLVDTSVSLTYAETLQRTQRLAAGLKALGVEAGQHVLVMMDNHCDFALAWFAINLIGATMVTANTAHKGDALRYIIENSQAETLIADDRYVEVIMMAVSDWRPTRTIIRGFGKNVARSWLTVFPFYDLPVGEIADSSVKASDASAIIYTSGTTGRSKGVVIPHGLMVSYSDARYHPGALEGDIVPLVYPMYYIGGPEVILNAAQAGATVVIFPRFSATAFWKAAATCGATYAPLGGPMANFLNRQPAGDHDRSHKIRRVRMAPVIKDVEVFKARFGIEEVSSAYGLTECSIPLIAPFGQARPGAIGWARPDFDVRIFDSEDRELPNGEIGEIVVRPKEPWSVMLGYHRMPEATAEMWRNLWAHTGDLGYRSQDGEFFFIDRKKESLRRRGENVSSQEVEGYIYQYPAVLECAVVPVQDEIAGGDEIKAYITLKEGHGFDFQHFIAFLADRMPHFWVPRFVEVLDDMPKGPTGKIRKQVLKTFQPGARAWDREREGIIVRR